MRTVGRSEIHVTGTERLIQRVIDKTSFRRQSDMRAEAVATKDIPAMATQTRNSFLVYLVALRTFVQLVCRT